MGSEPIVDVSVDGPVEPDRVGLGEEVGLAVRADEVAEDFVARLDLDGAASVVDGCGYGAYAVGARCSVEPNAFHGVVQQLVVCFGAVGFGPLVDFGEVRFALV